MRNAAERAIRDAGLTGFLLLASGFVIFLVGAMSTDTWPLIAGGFVTLLGVLTLLPVLIAQGIRLEQARRDTERQGSTHDA
ncbi:hypothetical protein [Nocardioides jishulii]|uniref:Uncharacterized protein n=1 Tax=Nocardioides jishulii TaxID=2575440 RepID=A0A4U2YNW2_9ACTN|nr:hypothetical protein [Nocardioides jishulii]QCX27883.1 hypothetical protein FCL41_10400 [Nocardioides jishulii]TKI62690.1 hypothetical protein FC770_10065 [Nocardioides jishulii]